MNYLTYPCKVMNITQSYNGSASHKSHTTGTPKDYPFDEACDDTGRSPMYCPCDEMKIVRVYTKGTNTLWLESTSKCNLADGTSDIVTLMVTHPNDSDFKNLTVGKKFKRGEIICYEGTDGNATGNHFHFSAGKGKIKGNGWQENSNKKWVLTTTNGTYKPESLFFIDKSFTTVKKANGIVLEEMPKYVAEKPKTENKPITKPVTTTNTVVSKAVAHTVKKGENLSTIAKKYGTNVNNIVKLNKKKYPTLVVNKNYIKVGWVLKVKE